MARLRAAVLAAGRGLRMGGRGVKTLFPVGEHRPLLFYILNGLEQAGVDDVLVVTGFRPRDVEAFVAEHAGRLGTSFVRNARYATWGNFHYVRMALEGSPDDDVLVVNSDVVVHPDVYRRVARSEGDLVPALEQRPDLDAEDMRVQIEGGRLMGIGKDLDMAVSHGEYDGVSLIRPPAARLYTEHCTRLEWAGCTSVYYEEVYQRLLGDVDGRAVAVAPGEYAEVDTPDDVPGAAEVISRHAWAWEAKERGPEVPAVPKQDG
ncbi:hypothetical protein BH18ACT15_BH18ACT15_03370 [soil metagenome]